MRNIYCAFFFLICATQGVCQSLFPVKDTTSKLYGYKDYHTLKWVIRPGYEQAGIFNGPVAIVSEKGLLGLINKKGTYLFPPVCKMLEGERFFTFHSGDSAGILNQEGKVLLSGKFSYIYFDPEKGNAQILHNNLYGYWDTSGTYIIPFSKYELVFENQLAYFNTGPSQGFVDKTGKRIIEVENGDVWDVLPFGYISRSCGKERVYDHEGKRIGDFDYDKIIQMREGVILYQEGERFGAMNYQGEELNSERYEWMSPFNKSGISVVKKEGRYGLVNERMQEIEAPEFQKIEPYGQDYNRFLGRYKNEAKYTLFMDGYKFGVMNDSGRVVVAPQYSFARIEQTHFLKFIHKDTLRLIDLRSMKKASLTLVLDFVSNKTIFCFEQDGRRCGIAGRQGAVLVSPIYHEIIPTYSNTFIVSDHRGAGLMDTAGNFVLPIEYKEIKTAEGVHQQYLSNSGDNYWDGFLYIITKEGRIGIAREDGKVIVKPLYENCSLYDLEGKCWFAKDKKSWKMVLESGKRNALKLEGPVRFNEGLAIGKRKGKYGLLSKEGKAISKFKYDEISDEENGLFYFRSGSFWGMLDKEGAEVCPPQLKLRTAFSSGLALGKKGDRWGVINSSGLYHAGFEGLRKDSTAADIDDGSVISFSFTNLSAFDEVSVDLLQRHHDHEFADRINTAILDSMQKVFSGNDAHEQEFLVLPNYKKAAIDPIEYKGTGVQISHITAHTITLNFFRQEYDSKKGINSSCDSFFVYFDNGLVCQRITLEDLFMGDYTIHLNNLIRKKSVAQGFNPANDTGDGLLFEADNFKLSPEALILQLNSKALGVHQGMTNVWLSIPYKDIKSILDPDGPARELYQH